MKMAKTNATFSERNPCPECYGWWLSYSTCNHEKCVCKTCGRPQCLLRWKNPMQTKEEAIHFLKRGRNLHRQEMLREKSHSSKQQSSLARMKIADQSSSG